MNNPKNLAILPWYHPLRIEAEKLVQRYQDSSPLLPSENKRQLVEILLQFRSEGYLDGIRFAAEQVDKLAKNLVGNTKTDGTRDSQLYEQGIGCECAFKMLKEIEETIHKTIV